MASTVINPKTPVSLDCTINIAIVPTDISTLATIPKISSGVLSVPQMKALGVIPMRLIPASRQIIPNHCVTLVSFILIATSRGRRYW